jgi:hypothetical protein
VLGIAGIVAGLALYVGLVQIGLIKNPLAPAVSGDVALAASETPGLRVLFVGNSFTSRNGMPELVRELAAGDPGGRPIFAVQYAANGWRLKAAADDDGLAELLRDVRWDVVILQEASRIPSLPAVVRRRETEPFAHALDARIERTGAETLLFMTWGYEDGDQANVPDDTFELMQARLELGYEDLGEMLSAPVAPVGSAWAEAVRGDAELELWGWDGQHPSRLGSYLTACVFYAVLTGRDPTSSRFTAGLDEGDARYLQRVAASVVAASS